MPGTGSVSNSPGVPPTPSADMPSDESIAFEHYRVLRRDDGTIWELGRGAMGVTYKAIDDNLHKVVALKVINAFHVERESSRDRFLREARAAASLSHRNVATVHHLGQNAQNFFYAMEFIDGETIDALVKRAGPRPWQEALEITIQVTRALAAAHEKRLVHRDIKPANIMLVPESGEDYTVVKLIDFGLAKTLLEEGGSIVAVSGSGFVGTPLFASPGAVQRGSARHPLGHLLARHHALVHAHGHAAFQRPAGQGLRATPQCPAAVGTTPRRHPGIRAHRPRPRVGERTS